jgi:signal transduction histidine kinase
MTDPQEALRAEIRELRASRARIVAAADAARRDLERDLHGGAQQRLVALSLTLKMARAKLESDPDGAARLLDSVEAEVGAALDDLRELARGIHPAVLSDRGLHPALEALARRAPVPVELSVPEARLPAPVEAAAYFVVAEALSNVVKYAKATKAAIQVRSLNGSAVVEVRDDGVGGAEPRAGGGLRGLFDRVAALDGTLELVSPPGEGTMIRVEMPCA